MKKRFCLILVLLAAVLAMSACHSDTDPWQPLPSGAPLTDAPTSQPTEEELAEKEVQEPDPEPTPGGESAPGING